MMNNVDVIVPVYNEPVDTVIRTVSSVHDAFAGNGGVRVIVVDDGSDHQYDYSVVGDLEYVRLLRHESNRGYGASLKSGVRAGTAPWIAIADADGTYPVERLPEFMAKRGQCDMVIGARIGDVREIPLLRRFPKKMLNVFASYMAGSSIPDLNSGLRIFTRELCEAYWSLLPNGYSFTSTLTMGATLSGRGVLYEPIDYYKRVGVSSIRPIRDTFRFFTIVSRLGLFFAPLKIFAPVAAVLLLVGAVKGFAIDYPTQGYVGNASVAALIAGLQIFMMGLLGELIVFSRGGKSR